ncbi:MAG TPA: glycosyltransferase, partial [Flavobacterium sp.]|nr:glycosyltransferase [Flavobacterium sp.]
MRIIQLIDSLEAGGAERMAVNYANALSRKGNFSALVATRQQGPLLIKIDSDVKYLFLNKKSAIDLKAVYKLRKFARLHKIEFIHAHSTSLYFAVMLKFIYPQIKIIWHDHYGNSEFLSERPSFMLRTALRFCDLVIAVNTKLENWIRLELGFKNTLYLPNFPLLDTTKPETVLKGSDNFRIICLANLREQKNHLLLLKVMARLKNTHPQWTLHLIGKDFMDEYS